MPTTRTVTAGRPGPVVLDVTLTAGAIRVYAESRESAEVTVSTPAADGVAADQVRDTRIQDDGGRFTVHVPDPTGTVSGSVRHGGVHQTVYASGDSVVVQQSMGSVPRGATVIGAVIGGDLRGSIAVSGGNVVISNGVVIGGRVSVEARLPLGSSLRVKTTSADVEAAGHFEQAQIRAVSGDVHLDGTGHVQITTVSGDVTIARYTGHGRIEAVSGDITVHAATSGASLTAETVSGDVRVTGARIALDAETVSGRVRTS